MIDEIQFRNFKSWKDTGALKLAPLTGLFGTNSSGKTSILQMLLMLKQTAESPDRKRVLHTGDERSLVDLGTFYDLIHAHNTDASLDMRVRWTLPELLRISNPLSDPLSGPLGLSDTLFEIRDLTYLASVKEESSGPLVSSFAYCFDAYQFGMSRNVDRRPPLDFDFTYSGYTPARIQGRPWELPAPVKCYGFPDEVNGRYQNMGFLSELVLAFEELFSRMVYLGPLREYPRRDYVWGGESYGDVGRRGELAIPAMLDAGRRELKISLGKGIKRQSLEERIAYWLRQMGMIHSYSLKAIAKHRKDYELRVKKTESSPEVLITDVGFGVSQILPILVLCYYVPLGTTVLLEQPEIHLHPSVQAWLADVLIEVVTKRKLQVILESHSEHLLRRIQRRIAEGQIPSESTALYFCRMENSSSSIEQLDVDLFGNIRNWPKDFFGDEMGELVAMTEAARRRQGSEQK